MTCFVLSILDPVTDQINSIVRHSILFPQFPAIVRDVKMK